MPILATITTVTFLMSGGGTAFSLDYARDAAKDIIKDTERVKQVVAVTKTADKEFKSFNKRVNELSKQLVEMNKGYNLTREEIGSFYIQYDKDRMAFLKRFVALHFEAKNLMTAEEWQAMYALIREEASK